ncbi:hypothetical protein J6590_030504 [Homalodisca vitripennis]|nr:hypothetical protein J6590_030504 [Homalodisca vitripennis]
MKNVESDPVALRRELEAARQALRTQTLRCRQMDVALSRRLEQKEVEVQNWKTLRDQQLSQIMRALMMLEARLRREQRNIRSQLGERDAVIRAQQLEISRLKKLLHSEVRQEEVKTSVKTPELSTTSTEFEYDCDVKPDLISSLGISHLRRNPDKSLTPTTTDNEDSQSNLDSLQFSFYEVGSQPESLMSNLSTQSCNGDASEGSESTKETAEYTRVSPPKPPQDHLWNEPNPARTTNNNNYFLDLKTTRCQELANNLKKLEVKVHMETQYPQKNVLSPVKEESSMSLVSACSSPSRCTPCDEQTVKCLSISSDTQYQDCKPSPSTLLQEVRISGRNEYEDNPVLSCVNQILLRDQEEFLEEQRALRLKEQEKSKKEAEAKLNNKKLTKSTENLSLLNEQIIVQHSPVKNKVYSPLNSVSPNHVTEQLIKHPTQPDIEEDHYKSITKSSSPKKRPSPKESPHVKSVPPALPPKPQRLLFSKSLDQKAIINSILPHMKGDESNALDIIKKRASLPNPSADSELYVISNSAIDDELLHQLQGRRIKSCSELPVSLNNSKPLTQSRESIYAPVLSHPNHKPPVKAPSSATPQKDKSLEQKTPPKKSLPRDEEASRVISKHSPTKKIMSPNSCIKVASPVSSLLNSVDVVEPSPGEEPGGKKTSPSVSQIVRRFEDLGTKVGKDTSVERTDDNSNSLQKNFEEFRLDECDMDTLCGDGRPEGDGAEMRLNGSAAVLEARISYENFLEATGLSQKSIVTPSRLFSNHKSVMKPKDVKHRSRVKAAAVVDRCNNNTPAPGSSIVRYWTEPFL